nr:MAG TPA: hypothetical protein [Caudoviricetes sp.]
MILSEKRNKTRIKTIRGAAEYSIRQDAPGDKLELTRIAALAPAGFRLNMPNRAELE